MNLTGFKIKSVALFPVLLLALALSGCAWRHHAKGVERPAVTAHKAIITPDMSLSAKVVSVDQVGRFVVLSFPTSRLPSVGQTLFLYRNGLKVAELNVTGPHSDSNIVADIIKGNAKVGDVVRND